MSITSGGIKMILEPEDEYCHAPDAAQNYNESMYFNVFDPARKIGGWFRLGNRVNEGYAEMSACVYLPDGRIGFMYGRPKIASNDEMKAGGMHFEVVTPFEHQRVTYDGKLCLLNDPLQMAHPSKAFKSNPLVDSRIRLDYRGVAPMYGGRPVREDGSDLQIDPEKSFAKAHYEQHVAASGTIEIGSEHWDINGFGLRDKSWGPRYWQAVSWYRWLPMSFGPDFAMMISIIGGDGEPRRSGMVLRDGEYVMIRDARIESDWDDNWYQTHLRAWARTDEREYEVSGRVMSMIPLRNRRKDDAGNLLVTRITEGMTEYTCDGKTGYGLSEYLDQIVDGKPVGPDVG
jgi:hypothetical protein